MVSYKDTITNLKPNKILEVAGRVISYESEAISSLIDRLDDSFLIALEFLDRCEGKIIVTGLGKSGIAAKKIAATLTSTGAPALFMHSAEAVHGDMGVVSSSDVAICLSYSGETKELIELIPRFKLLGVPIIAMTGKRASSLGSLSDCILDVSVPSYPWPYGILPTSSSAVTVAFGDALAVALLVSRDITEENFAHLHPGGLLGKKMLVKVENLMHTGDALPLVSKNTGMRAVLIEMTTKRLGVTCVLDENERLEGVITDGDLRRLLEKYDNLLDLTAGEVMTQNPVTIRPSKLSAHALHIMENHSITSLPVTDDSEVLIGLIHLHDILKLETQR